ncbi:hypothetical protein RND71_019144 [Anisodus tanguticus]|uniref:Uncharacterized protein n=1 Tax=Anisodus tanguticus TaxID=243964 RepID=A0AAE1RYW8_9SOLA|nr:hypothetical protein RND71_019144 [Anisodus tanguticus]
MLEFEVRREFMMEIEVAMWGGDRFASLIFPPKLPFLKQQADAMSLQRCAVEPKVSTLQHVPKNQSAEAEILLVQPTLRHGLRRDSRILLVRIILCVGYCHSWDRICNKVVSLAVDGHITCESIGQLLTCNTQEYLFGLPNHVMVLQLVFWYSIRITHVLGLLVTSLVNQNAI